jgi:hypothetical protein
MRRWFILILSAFLLSSCGLFRKVEYIPIEGKSDSIYIERLVVDTVTIEIPGETLSVVTQDSSHLETKYSVSDAKIDSLGRLHHSLTNKDIKIEKEIVYKEKEVKVEKKIPYPVKIPEKYVPPYYKKVNILFWSIIGIFVIFIVFKLRKVL